MGKGPLQFDDYSDEYYAWYLDGNGKRRRFMNVQYEGTVDDQPS